MIGILIIIQGHISGTPLLNMLLWCFLRVYNNEKEEGPNVQHDQDGLDQRDTVVGEVE